MAAAQFKSYIFPLVKSKIDQLLTALLLRRRQVDCRSTEKDFGFESCTVNLKKRESIVCW